jgi:[acyl-carrier-protein] S-malonyltransferase
MSTGPAIELNLHKLLSLPTAGRYYALIFPGQGSQKVGMAADVLESSPSARDVFEVATATFGDDLAHLCAHSPEERLNDTANAQPAILTASLAYLAAALEACVLTAQPAFLAGHSLGEYTALVAAGSLDPAEAVRLVAERGRLMAEAGRTGTGTMAAILGLQKEHVADICTQSGAEPANFNGPTQVVVGGTPEAVTRACELARSQGGKALPVNVSGAFHTSLMRPAAERFAVAVESASIQPPRIPVVGNVTASPLRSAQDVRQELKLQIASPVQWQASVTCMIEAGVESFVEFGPGRVLSAMLKRMAPDIPCSTLDSVSAFSEPVNV